MTGSLVFLPTRYTNIFFRYVTCPESFGTGEVILAPQVGWGVEIRLLWVPRVSDILDIINVYHTNIITGNRDSLAPFSRGFYLSPHEG